MRNKKISNNNQGFTLIELLIVIIILGILTTIGFVYLNPAQWTARANDTKRLSDVKNIHDAIQRDVTQGSIILSTTASEYNTLGETGKNPGVDATSLVSIGFVRFTATVATYKLGNFPSLPIDPKNNTVINYKYIDATGKEVSATTTAKYKFCNDSEGGYELNTVLENDSKKMNEDGGNDPKVFEIGTNRSACTSSFDTGTATPTETN